MRAIYKITNIINNKIYIGSSKDVSKRFKTHLRSMKNGTHHSIYLQRAFDKYGEDNFNFSVLYELNERDDLFAFESLYINEFKPEYNVGSVGGGDNLSNNPKREEIIENMKISVRLRYDSMTSEERKKIYGKSGDLNGNWKGGKEVTHKKCGCGVFIQKHYNTCLKCRDISGVKNPFYKKKHTIETLKRLSEANKGKTPVNIIGVIANNITYESLSDCAKAYNITKGGMHYRVNSKLKKWEEYRYV